MNSRFQLIKELIGIFLLSIFMAGIALAFILSFRFDPMKDYDVPSMANNVENQVFSPTGGYKYLQLEYKDIKVEYATVGETRYMESKPVEVPQDATILVSVGDIVENDEPIYSDGDTLFCLEKKARVKSVDIVQEQANIFFEYITDEIIVAEVPVAYYELVRCKEDIEIILLDSNGGFVTYEKLITTYDDKNMHYCFVFSGLNELLISGYLVEVSISLLQQDNVLLLDKRCTISLSDEILVARNVSWKNGVPTITEETLHVNGEIGGYFIIEDNGCAGKYYAYYVGNGDWQLEKLNT